MKHTLGTAAKATGVSKSTIYRAVKSGKLSASRNADDEYEIDPAELHRVYEPVSERASDDDMTRDATVSDTGNDTMLDFMREQVTLAQSKAEAAELEADQVKADLLDTQARLDEHRDNARLLENKSQEWQQALAERQAEIEAARHDASELQERLDHEQAERLKSDARAKAMQSRGLFARLLNREVEIIQGGSNAGN